MQLVVDANILLSVMISARGSKRKLLFSDEIECASPEILLFEIGKHWKEICDKSKLSDGDLSEFLSLVREQIKTFPFDKYSDMLGKSKEICPHLKDAEYFALALKLNCPIWSEDKSLKKQSEVKVFNTKELIEKLGLE